MTTSNTNKDELSPAKQALIALKQMQAKIDSLEAAQKEPIAIIGMACRFPGGADTPERFWDVLRAGTDTVREIPPERWDPDTYCQPEPILPGRTYLRHAAMLDQIDMFDTSFFGIAPREAVMMDPQQRLLLELCWEALERAAYAPAGLYDSRSGVFMGLATQDYAHISANPPAPSDIYTTTGNAISVAAGRIAYVLGLHGPAMVIDTACSSSLAAVHLACQSLRLGECKLALAGGVTLLSTPLSTVLDSQIKCYAPDGRCKTFDMSADGYGRGEGGGVLVLKRLSEARRDNDMILAVIRGSALNHDGPSSGLTVPNGMAQQNLIRDALKHAGADPAQIGYVEAHGTGTSLGDPIEMGAIGSVFGQRSPPLIVGSVKTNIGHLEAAAGIAGLIKAVLAMQHGEIPPHLHFEKPNPAISWDSLSVHVPTDMTPFPLKNGTRMAGVSSFGLSGTNAHIILEVQNREDQKKDRIPVISKPHRTGDRAEASYFLLPLSAQTEKGLHELAESYLCHLSEHPELSLADVCHTAGAGRSHFDCRAGITAATEEEARQSLSAFVSDRSAFVSDRNQEEQGAKTAGSKWIAGRRRTAFLFTGHGTQHIRMGHLLYRTSPVFRDAIDECAALLQPYMNISLTKVILYPDNDDPDTLMNTMTCSQPAIFAIEYALARVWQSWGIEPDVVMGHSIGQYAAACIAGVFNLEDALRLVSARGRLMDTVPHEGRMATVFAEPATVEAVLEDYHDQVSVASVNSQYNVVVSGKKAAMERLMDVFTAKNIATRKLDIAQAGHSPLLDPILDEFEQVAGEISYHSPRIELISGLTGQTVQHDEVCNAEYWRKHLREPVQFAASIATIFESGDPVILEIGPHPNLSNLGPACLPDEIENEGLWLSSLHNEGDDWHRMLAGLRTLYVNGASVDWTGVYKHFHQYSKVLLPVYPFQRQRYWADQEKYSAPFVSDPFVTSLADRDKTLHPLLGKSVYVYALRDGEQVFETVLTPSRPSFMADHQVYGQTVMAGAAWLEMAMAAAHESGMGKVLLNEVEFHQALVLSDNIPRTVQIVLTSVTESATGFEIVSAPVPAGSQDKQTDWTLHTVGRLTAICEVSRQEKPDPEQIRNRLPQEQSGNDLYQRYNKQGITYGPSFRVIDRVWHSDTEALGYILLPDAAVSEKETYLIHPVITDACFQCVGVLSSKRDVYVPVHIEQMAVFDSPVLHKIKEMWCHARITETSEHRYTADITLFSPDRDIIAKIRGFTEQRIQPDSLSGEPWKDWLYQVTWHPRQLSLPKFRPNGTKTLQGTWLVFADAGGVGQIAAEQLRISGVRCVLVVKGDESVQNEGDTRTLPEYFPAVQQDAAVLSLQSLLQDYPDLRGVVSFWGLEDMNLCNRDVATDTGILPDHWMDIAQDITGGTLCLVQALAALPADHAPPRLCLATRGTQPVAGSEIYPVGAMLWGMGKVIALEHPEWRCIRIDLDPSDTDEVSARAVCSELLSSPAGPAEPLEDQLAFRQGIRHTARLTRYAPRDRKPLPVRPDRTYLITGGLGGLGLLTARWFTERGAGRLLLTGRRQPGPSAREELEKLAGTGTTVEFVQADITDSGQLADTLEKIGPDCPLGGIIHAAGVLDDGILLQQVWSRFAQVLSPKVHGVWNLHTATMDMQLDFFVAFSSDAAILGNGGQANHAAANAFLDAMAWYRNGRNFPALSINWGAWSKVGVAAGLSERIDRQGMAMIEPDQGMKVLETLLCTDAVQASVSPVDWKRFAADLPHLAFWAEFHRPSVPQADIIREQLKTTDNPQEFLLKHIREQAARVLGWQESENLDLHQPFFNLGMDSLTALELRNRLQTSLDIKLASTLIFRYPNMTAVAEHCATHLFPEDTPPSSPGQETVLRHESESGEHDAEHLSDDELGNMLDDKLSKLEEWL